ncbi:MAG TPA: hypothetical protein VN538_06570 [Clostridia bacterium]|nr:hypothetical protein [Clostridia bacterium]
MQAIFSQKNWSIDEGKGSFIFDRFCEMLAFFNESQQELLIKLTEDFLWIRFTDYLNLFYRAFDEFIKEYPPSKCSKIIVAPLITQDDINKHKSSSFLHYMVSNEFDPKRYASYETQFVDNNAKLIQKAGECDKVCLIDDFIGAGAQAHSVVEYLETKGVSRKKIVILSLVIQSIGYDRCCNENVEVFYAYLRNRGISDNPERCLERTELMKQIEEIVSPPFGYNFGRERTEALVRMIDTPNNTFPVFWCTKSGYFPAPFPRKQK